MVTHAAAFRGKNIWTGGPAVINGRSRNYLYRWTDGWQMTFCIMPGNHMGSTVTAGAIRTNIDDEDIPYIESREDYEARIFTDLQTSVDLIKANVGSEVTYFAHPHGQKDEWAEDFVKGLFPVTTTSEVAVADLNNGIQDLPRYNISMDYPLSHYMK